MTTRAAATAQRFPKLAALLLGAASAYGFQPFGLWPVTLVALALLMLLVASAPRGRRAFGTGWAFGVGHFAVGLNWIATAFTFQAAMPAWLGWIAVVLLSLYLAIYPALAAWGAWRVARMLDVMPTKSDEASATWPFILAFASLWIITEWLRSWVFTGFAWNPLGATMLWAASPVVWIGTYGLSGLVVLVAGLYVLPLLPPYSKRSAVLVLTGRAPLRLQLAVGTVFAIAMLAVYFNAFRGLEKSDASPITIVQPNVGQQDKWEGAFADANFAKLANNTGPANSNAPRLILWPEAAIPDYLEAGYPPIYYDRSPAEARGRLTSLMRPGDLMLLGALKLELDATGEVVGARNAVMTVRPDGSLGPRYDKAHLVPYGEYLPMRSLLSRIGLSRLAPGDIDFWAGPGPRTIDLGRFGKAGVQICYEIIFSGQVVDRANRPDFIFNPSNDAWFGSWGPPQHLAQARMRAIEEGLPVIRATPTGISAVIDANGGIIESLPMGVAGRIDADLPPAHKPTLFARYGNVLPLLLAAVLMLLAIANRVARR